MRTTHKGGRPGARDNVSALKWQKILGKVAQEQERDPRCTRVAVIHEHYPELLKEMDMPTIHCRLRYWENRLRDIPAKGAPGESAPEGFTELVSAGTAMPTQNGVHRDQQRLHTIELIIDGRRIPKRHILSSKLVDLVKELLS